MRKQDKQEYDEPAFRQSDIIVIAVCLFFAGFAIHGAMTYENAVIIYEGGSCTEIVEEVPSDQNFEERLNLMVDTLEKNGYHCTNEG